MKHTFLFATIASILSINAYAVSTTVTSKDYVDTTRQATIPASGTNSATPGDTVVTYTSTAGTIGERGIFDDWSVIIEANNLQDNLVTAGALLQATDDIWDNLLPELLTGTAGTVPVYDSNGELGSAERGIYDGSNGYNSSTDANKLITAGAVNTMAPELPTGNSGYAVLYDGNGDIGAETPIDYWGSGWFNSEGGAMVNGHDEDLITAKALRENLIYDISTQHEYHSDGAIITGQALIRYAQPRKTCAGWADGTTTPDATHTNANCVLWNFPEGEYYWEFVGRN